MAVPSTSPVTRRRKMEESESKKDVVPFPAKRSKNPGVRVQGGRIYDSENGKTCHQCRQKTMDFSASCKATKREKPCTIHFCHKCLLNRYGEKAEQVSTLDDWKCPKCRGVCNCSFCMKQKGQPPTGILVRTAKLTGFSSVHELLSNGGENVTRDATVSSRESPVRPPAKPLSMVAGFELPAEDVGPVLQFLEFCTVFSKQWLKKAITATLKREKKAELMLNREARVGAHFVAPCSPANALYCRWRSQRRALMADMAGGAFAPPPDPDGLDSVRMTWNSWPRPWVEASKRIIPFAASISPIRSYPNPVMLLYSPLGCKPPCSAILNPFHRGRRATD